ncbi:AAA family ATPase [archaeon]|jgi:ABC-type cobalamin/Fe3+-siderophores transport system ATPase subunit|nr:AAA family ATPase [archaeon]
MTNILIKLSGEEEITGNHPVVLIGPNGSGKTTFGNALSKLNNAEWIGATRNLQFADSIAMQTPEQAIGEVTNQKNSQKEKPWMLSNELNQLLAKLKAEDADSAIQFRNVAITNTGLKPEITKIIQLTNLWNFIFPKREINFSSYSPKVKTNHRSSSATFGISRMSGGERVALYLLARVLDAPNGLIFIDEPEIHFHGVLAKKFWNELEILRPDCRFIYITHDLPFAISRTNVQFIIVNSDTNQKVLEQQNQIPEDVIESVLGAATFSVSANKVIFCEGSKNNKRDDELYSAWFDSENTAVIPVGSCNEVIKCVEVFNQNQAIQGVVATGIIDRDFRSDDYLNALPSDIHTLPVHELESLLCIKSLFIIVGKKIGKSKETLETLYFEVIDEVVNHFVQNEVDKKKIILERVKQRTEWQSKNLLNSVNNPTKSFDEIKDDYLDALKIENWIFSPEEFFDEEVDKIETILSTKNIEDLLKVLPGKIFFGKLVQKLEIQQTVFLNIIISALNDSKSDIRGDIVLSLNDYLPQE